MWLARVQGTARPPWYLSRRPEHLLHLALSHLRVTWQPALGLICARSNAIPAIPARSVCCDDADQRKGHQSDIAEEGDNKVRTHEFSDLRIKMFMANRLSRTSAKDKLYIEVYTLRKVLDAVHSDRSLTNFRALGAGTCTL